MLRMSATGRLPYFVFSVLYVLSANIFRADHTKTASVYWKLDALGDKVISVADSPLGGDAANLTSNAYALKFEQDKILQALLSTDMKDGIWTKRDTVSYCKVDGGFMTCNGEGNFGAGIRESRMESPVEELEVPLDCGKSVNFTHYDHLVGVSHRQHHPQVPEPRVELVFRRRGEAIDVDQLERKLRRSKREKPKSLELYNQIGNFWRIKGDTSKAIECFRRSLAVSPNNAEVLLNLARVLFNLQYLDDAIFLTRRSLEMQPPDQSAWLQHFTLGEILKEYGNYQEAEMHLRHTLELRPRFPAAEAALRALETTSGTRVTGYTVFIICVLVLGVGVVMLLQVESAPAEGAPEGCRSARCAARAARGRWRRSV